MTVAYHSAQIPAAGVVLEADIAVPQQARGLVLFAHGSGSSRFSPRNRYVAGQLQHAGLATVLADLLTPAEEQADARTGQMRFDIGLLAVRLTALGDWLAGQEATAALVLGLFGASTGAAVALVAAAARPAQVRAVVSRGGRPDLAAQVLPRVHQPVLGATWPGYVSIMVWLGRGRQPGWGGALVFSRQGCPRTDLDEPD